MRIERTYEHAEYGMIGAVALEVPAEGWTLDGKPLSEASVRHLATFALQTLQDAYAGAKTEADAAGNFGKKYDRLIDGTIGTRLGGPRGDRTKVRAITIAMGHAKVVKNGEAFVATLGKLSSSADKADKARRAVAVRAVEANPAYRHLAEQQLTMEAEMGIDAEDVEVDEAA